MERKYLVGRGIHGVAGSDHNPSIGQNIFLTFRRRGTLFNGARDDPVRRNLPAFRSAP